MAVLGVVGPGRESADGLPELGRHEDVDDGVEGAAQLGKHGGQRGHLGRYSDPAHRQRRDDGVGCPAHQEATDHDTTHLHDQRKTW